MAEQKELSPEELDAHLAGALTMTGLRCAARISERFPQTLRKVPWMASVIAEEFRILLGLQTEEDREFTSSEENEKTGN